MNLQREYEKRFGEFPVSNITWYLIAGQLIAFVLLLSTPAMSGSLSLRWEDVRMGDWWRILTFLFVPASLSPLWAVFQWYVMYMIGNALEREWGAFRYFLYLFIGFSAALAGAIMYPASIVSNAFIFSSLFFAFAYLNPEFSMLLFFILPVKIKWLAWISWIALSATFFGGNSSMKLQILLSICNFLSFFGREIYTEILYRVSRGARIASKKSVTREIYMQCAVCHKTQDDRKIFYYCHTCIPEVCYCDDHIKSHKHRVVN